MSRRRGVHVLVTPYVFWRDTALFLRQDPALGAGQASLEGIGESHCAATFRLRIHDAVLVMSADRDKSSRTRRISKDIERGETSRTAVEKEEGGDDDECRLQRPDTSYDACWRWNLELSQDDER